LVVGRIDLSLAAWFASQHSGIALSRTSHGMTAAKAEIVHEDARNHNNVQR
jgi:hypothetical protein